MQFTFDCRNTGQGAYTSAGGRQFAFSKSGNHWREIVDAEVGDVITITDISNTGKHHCRRCVVLGERLLELVETVLPSEPCAICGGN